MPLIANAAVMITIRWVHENYWIDNNYFNVHENSNFPNTAVNMVHYYGHTAELEFINKIPCLRIIITHLLSMWYVIPCGVSDISHVNAMRQPTIHATVESKTAEGSTLPELQWSVLKEYQRHLIAVVTEISFYGCIPFQFCLIDTNWGCAQSRDIMMSIMQS